MHPTFRSCYESKFVDAIVRMSHYSKTNKFCNLRIVKFLGVGLLNTAFGYSIYSIFVFVGLPYLIALFIATIVGVVFNYFSFGRFVFHGRAGLFVFGKFIAVYGVVYFSNAAVLGILTKNYQLDPYIGQAICIPPSVFLSWLLMNYWVYKRN